MNQNKILSLEEIEKAYKAIELVFCIPNPSGATLKAGYDAVDDLLATARAYCHTFDILKNNIPRMRQWLNEDRITDVKRLVDNEDLSFWLLDMPLPDGESLPSGGGFTATEKEKIVKFLGSKQ